MKRSNNEQVAQGDVLFTPRNELPASLKKLETKTVAYGEATGHHHTFTDTCELFEDGNGIMWVVVGEEGADIDHQEHDTIRFAPGIYEVSKQVEPDPFLGIRRVQD